MSSEQTILQFINLFHDAQDIFLNGLCYWFAKILSIRFQGEIYYEPIENHFVAKLAELENGILKYKLYDIRGDVTESYKNRVVPWFEFSHNDPALAKRIVRDCIKKEQPND